MTVLLVSLCRFIYVGVTIFCLCLSANFSVTNGFIPFHLPLVDALSVSFPGGRRGVQSRSVSWWKERGTEPSGVLVEGERYRAVRYLGRRREVQSRPLSWWKERGTEPFGVLVERERYRAVRCYRTPKGLVVNFIAYQHFIELI